jgi:hypothetical protein
MSPQLTYDPDDPNADSQFDNIVAVREQLRAAQEEFNRRRWLKDPVAFCTERLGEFLWSKQREVMRAVRDHRLVAVPSAHATGKSFLAARLVLWWIETHPPGTATVVTTASTWKQVEVVLWKELRRAHTKAKLKGYTNRTEWACPIEGGDGRATEIVAFGHRPADTDPSAFQGIHNQYVLVIIDEAVGVPKLLWESADSLTSNEDSRIVAFGNPTDPVCEFAEVCKPTTDWHVIKISAFDTPNVYRCENKVNRDGRIEACGWEGQWNTTGQHNACPDCSVLLPLKEAVPDEIRRSLVSYVWVKEKAKRWGRTNPLYISRVLGEFPEFNTDSLIPTSWIRKAQERWETLTDGQPVELGVDFGGGADKNVIASRRGRRVRIEWDDHQPDTMKTAQNVIRHLRITGATIAKLDYIGIGRGAGDYLKKDGHPVMLVEVGNAAVDNEAYLNLRAEAYWNLRELFRPENPDCVAIDPTDDELEAQLLDIRYQANSGRIQIESKESMKRRGRNSPDKADAVMLACLPSDHGQKDWHLTWGRDISKYQHLNPQPKSLLPANWEE